MNKKKILFVAEELDINGAMFSLLELLKALPKDKYDISLFLFSHEGKMMKQIPSSVTLLPISLPYAIHRFPLRKALLSAFKTLRLDLVLYRFLLAYQRAKGLNYNLWAFLPKINGEYDVVCCYTDGFVAPMILRKVNARKKCAWIHAPYSHWEQMPCVYEALRCMDVCVPVSKDTGRDLDNILGENVRKHIVHNITDAERCKQRALEPCEIQRQNGIYRIVSVGRVSPPKFFDIIPSVAKLLNKTNLQYEWYIIGNGDKYKELDDEVRDKHLDDKVHFIGARPNPMPWIESADVFVNPSRFEAWGMTVSEALCLGKAVIVSDIPVFAEQVTDGVNGLIRHVTPKNIADAILLILHNDSLRHRLEQNAVDYKFTKQSVVKEFDLLIEKLDV